MPETVEVVGFAAPVSHDERASCLRFARYYVCAQRKITLALIQVADLRLHPTLWPYRLLAAFLEVPTKTPMTDHAMSSNSRCPDCFQDVALGVGTLLDRGTSGSASASLSPP